MKGKMWTHKQYMRIVEIMVTDEYAGEMEKLGAIGAICERVYDEFKEG